MEILNEVNLNWNKFFNDNIDELNNILSLIDYENEIIYPEKTKIFKCLQ